MPSSAPSSSTHPDAPSTTPTRSRRRLWGWVFLLVLVALPGAAMVKYGMFASSAEGEETATFVIVARDLQDTVIERGTIESQSRVDGVCELHGWQNKITFIVDEGTTVKKGDVVVRFDASEIETELANQRIQTNNEKAAVDEAREQIEVQKNKNESDIAAAKLEQELAALDLKKYSEGDYIAELADMDRSIAESSAALEQKSEELKNMRILVKKGYREPERLRQMEQAEKSAKFQLERDEQKKEVLTKYTYKRQITELSSKSEEATRKLDRAHATAKAELAKAKLKLAAAEERLKIQERELKEYEDQLSKTEIKASHSGTVAYANHRHMDPSYKIRSGGNVHRRQTVFHLPDMTRMQVELNVHESLINKLSVGQRAVIRVDSFPDQSFLGRIDKIADLARSDGDFFESKKYTAIVLIDSFPEDIKLKPGMTAEAEIHVRKLEQVLAVPVQAVTQVAGKEYAYRMQEGKFQRVEIDVEEGNEAFLIVQHGLDEGDQIAMDAHQRGQEDVELEELSKQSDSDLLDPIEAETETSASDADSDSANEEADSAHQPLSAQTSPDSDLETTPKDDATPTDQADGGADSKDSEEPAEREVDQEREPESPTP